MTTKSGLEEIVFELIHSGTVRHLNSDNENDEKESARRIVSAITKREVSVEDVRGIIITLYQKQKDRKEQGDFSPIVSFEDVATAIKRKFIVLHRKEYIMIRENIPEEFIEALRKNDQDRHEIRIKFLKKNIKANLEMLKTLKKMGVL